MPRACFVLALLLSLLAGCSTPQVARPSGTPPAWLEEHAAPQTVTLPPELTPHFPIEPIPRVPPATNAYAESWISFDRWCREHNLPQPITLSGATPSYVSGTPAGRLVLRVDNLALHWDGLEVRLGFAPRLIDGKPFISGVDAQKTLLPLVQREVFPPRSNGVIVLDPGHGGENGGTKSILGEYYEKTYTLDWAKRLAPLLSADGWRVVLTRTNDIALTLPERVALAEREQADLFISLHFNSAAPNQTQNGLETYCLTPTGLPSSLTREYADDPAAVFPNNSFDADNLRLAVRLHRELLSLPNLEDRGVRHARFMGVLRGQNRPAVLLEGGYLSNPKEAKRIADPQHRQQLAEAVARALRIARPVARVVAPPETTETK